MPLIIGVQISCKCATAHVATLLMCSALMNSTTQTD
uniref:Uncharacterized protein n=1 Tax=Anguilla anguilla TaxID=7936 RepID=A0A0E9T4N3_ANGAN